MSLNKNTESKSNIGKAHYEMMRRCYNSKHVAYKDYGAKGITVCPEWHDRETFRKWALENGYKKGLRLNRKDSSQGYTPSNCYWGTTSVQVSDKNKRIKERALDNKSNKIMIGLKRITDSQFYGTFRGMHSRCESPSNPSYYRYGGRGITVCDEWSGTNGIYNFILWANSNGWQPGLTLDRIDNNKGYSPDNCRWATLYEQANNTRRNVHFDYHGENLTLADIARRENIRYNLLHRRVRIKCMNLYDAIDEVKAL